MNDITETALLERGYDDTSWEDEGTPFKEKQITCTEAIRIVVGLFPDFYVYLVIGSEWEKLSIDNLNDLDTLVRLLKKEGTV